MTRRVERKRLAYYGQAADEQYWGDQWAPLLTRNNFHNELAGKLGWFEQPFTRFLPKKGKILEAGCGTGKYVIALNQRGFDVEGIEWSKKTVNQIRKLFPKLKITVGDVTDIAVPDGHYTGYISLGVIEHHRRGPEPFLREARRVLTAGGVALISVPHFNSFRQMKARLGFYRRQVLSHEKFYQYAFTEAELAGLLTKFGFQVMSHFRYDGFKGLRDDIGILKPALSQVSFTLASIAEKKRKTPKPITRQSRPSALKLLDRIFGHMTMVICQKS